VEFADNSGGSYLQSLKNNYQIPGDIQNRTSVVVPGEPALSLQKAQPVPSAVKSRSPAQRSPGQTPRTTETSP